MDNSGWTPLMIAASSFSSTPEIVSLLLEKGAEIEAKDNDGWTPLMSAAGFSKTPEIVTLLLDAGADALAKDKAGKKAIDHAKENVKLKGTKAYKKLRDKSFE
ncbi:MAG: ankyrin repeat domain-containing protein [Planctomycetota bacterium]|nr:ankyrin repeat domain-containing protein [Planctomycetota bacterium]